MFHISEVILIYFHSKFLSFQQRRVVNYSKKRLTESGKHLLKNVMGTCKNFVLRSKSGPRYQLITHALLALVLPFASHHSRTRSLHASTIRRLLQTRVWLIPHRCFDTPAHLRCAARLVYIRTMNPGCIVYGSYHIVPTSVRLPYPAAFQYLPAQIHF